MVSVPESWMFLHIYRTGKCGYDNYEAPAQWTGIREGTSAGKTTTNSQSLWLRVKAVKPSANSCLISKKPHLIPVQYRGFLRLFPGWPESVWVHVYGAWKRMSLMRCFWRESPCVVASETIYGVHENQSVKRSGQAWRAAHGEAKTWDRVATVTYDASHWCRLKMSIQKHYLS